MNSTSPVQITDEETLRQILLKERAVDTINRDDEFARLVGKLAYFRVIDPDDPMFEMIRYLIETWS